MTAASVSRAAHVQNAGFRLFSQGVRDRDIIGFADQESFVPMVDERDGRGGYFWIATAVAAATIVAGRMGRPGLSLGSPAL